MKVSQLFLVPIFGVFNLCIGFAQQVPSFTCVFDAVESPAQARKIQGFEEQLRLHLSQKNGLNAAKGGSFGLPYTIPVVVHLIHDGGPENISDAQVAAAIHHLNDAFAAQGYFAQLGATDDTQIQFCLASRDPDGNTSSGITRTQSPLTDMVKETDDLAVKNLSRWNPLDYVNIWVVKEISSQSSGSGVAGYAYFPSSHGDPEDGMVCEAQFFGTSPAEDGVFIHEMGHYLGLYHTFEGGCPNGDCTVDGDRVCDTPPDQATHTGCAYNSCSTDVAAGSPFASDVNDFTGDFMDYSPFSCYHFFTKGQALRMQGSIETVRKSLLDSRGCGDPCLQPVAALFSVPAGTFSAGQTIVLDNQSTNATQFLWKLNGVFYSNLANPAFTFPGVGVFEISLTASNADPNCSDKISKYLSATCPVVADFNASSTSVDPGQTVVFTSTSVSATVLQWFINGVSLGSGPTFIYAFSTPGEYTVVLEAGNGFCQSAQTIFIGVKSPCGQGPSGSQFLYNIGNGDFYPYCITATPDGGLLTHGKHTQGNNTTGIVQKTDANGNIKWAYRLENAAETYKMTVSPNDNTYVLAGQNKSTQTVFLMKMAAATGATIWKKDFRNVPTSNYTDLLVLPGGDVLLLFDRDKLARFLPDGTLVWSKTLGVENVGFLNAIARRPDGVILVTGFNPIAGYSKSSIISMDENGNLLGVRFWGAAVGNYQPVIFNDLVVNADNSFLVAGSTRVFGSSYTEQHGLVFKCDAAGNLVWSKKLGFQSTPGHSANKNYILPTSDGGYILYGAPTIGFENRLFMKIDGAGNMLWGREYGVPNTKMNLANIAENQTSGCWLAMNGSNRLLIAKVDGNGSAGGCNELSHTIPVSDFPLVSVSTPMVVAHFPLDLANDMPTTTSVVFQKQTLCSQMAPCPEICDNDLDDDGDDFVDCFDSDCDCFEVDTACTVPPPVNNFSAKVAWKSAVGYASSLTNPIVANLNPKQDKIPEIIVRPPLLSSSTVNVLHIFKGDGSNANNPSTLAVPAGIDWLAGPPTVADLDGNGTPEVILVTADKKIRVYTNFNSAVDPCMKLWTVSTQNTLNQADHAYVADFDSDGISEIFTGNDVFKLDLTNPSVPTLTRVLDGIGASAIGPIQTKSPTAADLLTRSDCNGDPDCDGLELVAGYHIYSIDLDPTDGDGLQIKIQRDLNALDPNHVHTDGYTSVADINLDGTPEIIVSGRRDNVPGIYIWNKNGLVHVFTHPTFGLISGMVCVANIFNDQTAGFTQDFPELVTCYRNQLVCFNLQKAQSTPAEPFWWSLLTTDDSGATGATVFDFNGDGLSEIVYRDEENLRIMYGGPTPFPLGVDSERNWFKATMKSLTFNEYPIVADVDNDGEAEIAVTGYITNSNTFAMDAFGQLCIFGSASSPWMPARPLWNQFNYFGLNINDDLSVPKHQQKHWLEVGGLGSGKRPFNTHLAQPESLNPLVNNRIKTPDVKLTLTSATCQTDSFELSLEVCNLGSAVLPSKTPLAFYNGDPRATNATLIFPPLLLPQKIEKGACENITLKIPATYNTRIFVVANDDGSVPRPFNLATAFPSTEQAECHYENNMASFSIPKQTLPLDLGPDISLCQNSVIQFKANPNFQRYRWQDGSTDSSFTAYTPGKYWVDAYDACGIRQTDTVHIALNTLAALDLPDDATICKGTATSLTVTGFSSYAWSPAELVNCANCPAVSVLAQQSATIWLTAAKGDCLVSDSVRLHIQPGPSIQLSGQDGTCNTPGRLVASATGAAPFTFLWSDMRADSILSISTSGTYTVTATDALGCTSVLSDSVRVQQYSLGLAIDQIGGCGNPAKVIVSSSAPPPYTFLWSDGSNGDSLTVTKSGIYTLTLTDANGCLLIDSIRIALDMMPIPIATVTPPTCWNTADASISVQVTNVPATIYWLSGPQIPAGPSNNLTGLMPGVYTYVAQGNGNCSTKDTIEIMAPPPMLLDIAVESGGCTLPSTLTASADGPAPIRFKWETGDEIALLKVSLSGYYTVTATDAKGCSTVDSAMVQVPVPPSVTVATSQNPKCARSADGAIALQIQGGTGPFLYNWSGPSPATGSAPSGLSAGSYTVTVTDVAACSAVVTVNLVEPPALVLRIQKIGFKCPGNPGQIDLTAVGGVPPLAFLWSNGATVEDINPTQSGTYTVKVSDLNGCTSILSDSVRVPRYSIGLAIDQIGGCGDPAKVFVSSTAPPPYAFLWSDGSNGDSLTATKSGIYTLTLTDANGCLLIDSIRIALDMMPIPIATVTAPTCWNTADASISVQVTNVPATVYWLSGPQIPAGPSTNLTGLIPGVYTYVAQGNSNCSAKDTIEIVAPPPMLLDIAVESGGCALPSTLTASASGLDSVRFKWETGDESPLLKVSLSGYYTVTATDARGCSMVDSAMVQIPVPPSVTVAASQNPKCAGSADGAIALQIQGGSGPFLYNWNGPSPATGSAPSGLSAGPYAVTVTDMAACSAVVTANLVDPPALVLTILKTDLKCPGDQGWIDLTAGGGVPPIAFLWSTGETTEDINPIQSGTYTSKASDANGCEQTVSTDIEVLGTVPVLTLTADTLTCKKTSGLLSAKADLPNTTFVWAGANGFTSTLSSPLVLGGGTYYVTATEPKGGCMAVGSVLVPVDTAAPKARIAVDLLEIPCDQTDLSLSAAGSSSGSSFSVEWTTTAGGTILGGEKSLFPNIRGAGFYELVVTNLSNGCIASDGVEVVQLERPHGEAVVDPIRCFGDSNGTIRVISTSGGTPPLTYSIDNQNFKTDSVFKNLKAGIYPISIRDANACVFSTKVELTEPPFFAVALQGDPLVVKGEMAQLQAIVSPPNFVPTQIGWSPLGFGFAQNQLQQSVPLLQNTLFQVTVADTAGCSVADTLLVRVEETRKIYAPNIILPENPSGRNQTFLIFSTEGVLEIESLQVFDRWGNQVFANEHFQPNDESQGWDGLFNGKAVPPGVFVWMAKVVLKDGTVEVLKGDLTVLR